MEESLRYNTSAQRFKRCIKKDTELHGQTMKAGDFVCMAYGSANRDERKFENPEALKPQIVADVRKAQSWFRRTKRWVGRVPCTSF